MVTARMRDFYIAASIYLGLSIALFAILFLSGISRRRLYRHRFGGRDTEELTAEEMAEWELIHKKTYDEGPWRKFTVFWMFFHYPGFLVCALICCIRNGGRLYGSVMFLCSAVVWVGLLFLLLRP
jgi:hypothetical protein